MPLTLIAALLPVAVLYVNTNRALLNTEQDRLRLDTSVRALALGARIGDLRSDVGILAESTAVDRVRRAFGTEDVGWKDELAAQFRGVMRIDHDIVQVRLIGLEDGGRELVRLNRERDGQVARVAEDALQHKAAEPYFRPSLELGPGEIRVSNMTLNREHAEIELPHRPMLRLTTLVRTAAGEPLGVLAVNVDARSLLGAMVAEGGGAELYVVNEDGGYLLHPDPSQAFAHELGETESAWSFLGFGRPDQAELLHVGPDRLTAVERIDLDEERHIYVVGRRSAAAITAVNRTALRNGLFLGGLIVLATMAAVVLASRSVTRPIRELVRAIRDVQEGPAFTPPKRVSGEAAELSDAFERSLARIRLRKEELRRSNAELERFAFAASHDLREPVRTVSSFARLLETRHADRLGEEGLVQLGFITKAAERMDATVEGLLRYARVNADADVEDVDLGALTREVVADLAHQVEQSGGTVDVGALPHLSGLRTPLRLLVQNLVSNALKYHRPGVPPRVEVRGRRAGAQVTLVVSDNGVGIPEDQRERAFHIFRRLHRQDEVEGTGIGLAQCLRIAHRHRGSIRLGDSALGGLEVTVTLGDLTDDR